MKKVIGLLLGSIGLLGLVALLSGCGSPISNNNATDPTNSAPSVAKVPNVDTIDVALGLATDLSVTATDIDGDVLTYVWSCDSGSFSTPTAATTAWTAPTTRCYKTLTATVSDGKGHTEKVSWVLSAGVIRVWSAIDANTTWRTGNVYMLSRDISVSAVLSIQPGVVVKGYSGRWLSAVSNGSIIANGTVSSHIVFTSARNDAIAGDNNLDNGAILPATNDWGGVASEGSGTQLSYCDFSYADEAFWLGSTSATITHCAFSNNEIGLSLSRAYYGTVVRQNVFYSNIHPFYINSTFDIDSTNIFHNPAIPTQKNTFQCMETKPGLGAFGIDRTINWSVTEVAYAPVHLSVLSTLNLAPGVVIKCYLDEVITITPPGVIAGLSGATFTSYKDDAQGGDANGDGLLSAPAAGDWSGIDSGRFLAAYDWVSGPNILYAYNP